MGDYDERIFHQRVSLFVIKLINPLPHGSSIAIIKTIFQIWISFHYQVIPQVGYVEKHETLSPWEDHQCRANPWNLRWWRHAPCTSERSLINFFYLHRELLIITILYFMIKELPIKISKSDTDLTPAGNNTFKKGSSKSLDKNT